MLSADSNRFAVSSWTDAITAVAIIVWFNRWCRVSHVTGRSAQLSNLRADPANLAGADVNSTLAALSVGHGHVARGPGSGAGVFLTTHWSVVLAAKTAASPEAFSALEKLCRGYGYPLHVFVRRQGHSPEDAEDLVQDFFARLLQKYTLNFEKPGQPGEGGPGPETGSAVQPAAACGFRL